MNGAPRRLLWVTTAGATVTGLAYAAFRYLMTGDDPFSAYNHPLQPHALHAHVLIVPAMLFAIGWFWGRHVLPKLRSETIARRSGLTLIALVGVMTVSGYGLQVAAGPGWIVALAWTHGVSGTAFTAVLAGHALAGLRATRRSSGPAAGAPPAPSAPSVTDRLRGMAR